MNTKKLLSLKNISRPLIGFVLFTSLINGLFAKSSIEQLTSKNTAKKVKDDIPQKTTFDDGIHKHSFGLGLGQTFPMGEFKTNGDSEITPDLYYNYSASHSFDLLLNFHSNKLEKGNKESELLGLALGIKAKIFNFDNFAPVGFGGFGFYRPTVKRDIQGVIKESEDKTVFGYHFGGGAELRLNNHVSTGILFHYHNPFDAKQDTDPEVEGSYYKLMLTLFYTL